MLFAALPRHDLLHDERFARGARGGGDAKDSKEGAEFAHDRTYRCKSEVGTRKSRIPSMIFTELEVEKRNRGTLFVLMAVLSLGFFGGCGGGWQPDPRDMPRSPMQSGVEGSGITGPEESRTNP